MRDQDATNYNAWGGIIITGKGGSPGEGEITSLRWWEKGDNLTACTANRINRWYKNRELESGTGTRGMWGLRATEGFRNKEC